MYADPGTSRAQWLAALAGAALLHAALVLGLSASEHWRPTRGDAGAARGGDESHLRVRLGARPAPPAPSPPAAPSVRPVPREALPKLAPLPVASVARHAEASAPGPETTDVAAGPVAPAAAGTVEGAAAPGDRTGSSVDGEVRADYFDAVFARVLGSLDYPRRARLERVEGVVLLRLRIDREGRLEDVTVAENSGAASLDRHAVRIAKRAAPFGPVPASFADADLSFELPVEFALRP